MIPFPVRPLIVLLIGSIPAGCSNAPVSDKQPPGAVTETHEDIALGILVDHPVHWTIATPPGAKQLLMESPMNDAGWQAFVIITVREGVGCESLKRDFVDLVDRLSKSEPEFELVDQREMFHEHWPASAMMDYTRNFENVRTRHLRVLVSNSSNRLLEASATAPLQMWGQHESDIRSILGSLRPLVYGSDAVANPGGAAAGS